MQAAPEPTPIHGKTLALSERLLDDDAGILDVLASSSVRHAGPADSRSKRNGRDSRTRNQVKPGGAPFLCIDPWRGFASPADFDGEFADKPGLIA